MRAINIDQAGLGYPQEREGSFTMKKSKRFLALLLALSMTAALAACSPDSTDDGTSTGPAASNQADEETILPDETGASGETAVSEEGTQATAASGGVTGVTKEPNQPNSENTTAPKAPTDPTKMSKEELVHYYNTAANDAKKNAKSITKTQNQASKVSLNAPSGLNTIANFLMGAFLSDKPKAVNETYASAADKNANFYVAGQSWSSKLSAADLASATCKKSGGSYIVTLAVKGGSVSKAFSTITKEQILEAVDGKVKFNKINVSYANSTIVATIGANGKLQKVSYDMPQVSMEFNVAMLGGLEASLILHIADWFTINW